MVATMMGLAGGFSGFRVSRLGAALALVGLIGGCATPPDPSDAEASAEFREINDPAEPLNRAVFSFNRGLDTMFLKPAAEFYGGIVPPPVQESVHNVLNNLRTPIILANDLLQGDLDWAGTTMMRFVINTTYGVAGLFDQAAELGYEYHGEDFGQTLAVWGVEEGPYLMLPVIGPSNPRDAVGFLVDMAFDPFFWWSYNSDTGEAASTMKTGANVLDFRTRNYDALEDLEKSLLDFYAAVRSLYRQRREAEISNGDPSLAPTLGFSTLPSPKMPSAEEQSLGSLPVTIPARRRFLAGLVAALLAPAALASAATTSTDRAEQFIRDLAAKGIELLTEDGLNTTSVSSASAT